jgi:hypothetical protein
MNRSTTGATEDTEGQSCFREDLTSVLSASTVVESCVFCSALQVNEASACQSKEDVMEKQSARVLWVFLAIVVVVVSAASVARADELVVAHVPFAFIVGDSRLPAGDYIVKEVDNDPSVISITSADGHQSTFILTMASSSSEMREQPRLMFEKFEDQYFLARVIRGDGSEREIALTPTIMEREVVATR